MSLPLLIELSLLGSLLTIVVLLLRRLGGSWLPAGIFCLAWLLVGVRLLTPLTPASPVSLLNLRPTLESLFQKEEASPPAPVPSSELRVAQEAPTGWARLDTVPEFSPSPAEASPVWIPCPWQFAGLLWLGGFTGLAGFALFGQWRFRRGLRLEDEFPVPGTKAQASRPATKEESLIRNRKLLHEAATAAGLRRPLPLRFSAVGTSPCLSGVFRPVIVMPIGLAATLDDRDLRLIYQHEMTHARRRDHWLHALLGLAACCHWFNPLGWWARRACRQDCELATDAALTRHADPTDRRAYGELLLKIARHSPPASSLILHPSSLSFTLPMASPGKRTLKHRITMLHRPTKNHPLTRLAGLLLLGLAALVAGTSAVEPTETPPQRTVDSATQHDKIQLVVDELDESKAMDDRLSGSSPISIEDLLEQQITLNVKNVDLPFAVHNAIQLAGGSSRGRPFEGLHQIDATKEPKERYQTDLVVAEVEDFDALMKLLEKADGLSIWDDFAPIQEALKKVNAEILSAPRLITEEGKRATISVADVYQERNDVGEFSHLKTGLVAEITVLSGDTAEIPRVFKGMPTVFLDGQTTAGERIRVDANGDLLPQQPGDQTISIRIDDPMPHPLGKVGIFGGLHSWSQTERTSGKHLIVFVRVSEWEPEQAASTSRQKKEDEINTAVDVKVAEPQDEDPEEPWWKSVKRVPIDLGQPAIQKSEVSIFGAKMRVVVLAQPVKQGAAAPRTLTSRILEAESPRNHEVAWEIEDRRLILRTDVSEGSSSLPEGFTIDQTQLDASTWQLGHFERNKMKWAVVLKIEAAQKVPEPKKRVVYPVGQAPQDKPGPQDRLSGLQSQLDELRIERATLSRRYAHKHPRMIEIEAKIDAVEAQIESTQPRYVSVLGQVNEQGRISLDPDAETIGLVEAIAAAGGPTRLAADRKVIVRPIAGDPMEIDFRAILYGEKKDVPLRPGSTVFVPERLF